MRINDQTPQKGQRSPPSAFKSSFRVSLTKTSLPLKMEELTEEQRKRAEANRLAALAKRKALRESTTNPQRRQLPEQSHQDPWRLFKCRKLSVESTAAEMTHLPKPAQSGSKLPDSDNHVPEKFRVTLQICSPDSFSVTPEPVQGFVYPGEEECLRRLRHCLSDVKFPFFF